MDNKTQQQQQQDTPEFAEQKQGCPENEQKMEVNDGEKPTGQSAAVNTTSLKNRLDVSQEEGDLGASFKGDNNVASFNDDVDQIIPSQQIGKPATHPNPAGDLSQRKEPVTVIDLSGKRIRDDKKRSAGTADNDSDSSSEGESLYVDYANLAYEKPFPMCSFYNMVKMFMKFSMQQFFKEIIIIGKQNVPKRGPVIFCGNHTNQFVDGSLVFFAAPRDTRFMVAAKSFKRPVLGTIFRLSHSVPVERAQDIAKAGNGVIEFADNMNVKGIGTSFSKDFTPGDSIKFIIPEGELKVEEQIIEKVVSDSEIILKKPGAKIHNPNIQYKYKILPKVDQSTVFKHCVEALGKGGSISMFPEGGSHDQSDLLPFKAGIALMTLGTIIETGQTPVIIPTGLKYFKHWEFRSDCIVEFGHPYKPSKKIVEYYKNGQKRKAVAAMLKDLENRMHDVTMTAPSYEEVQAIYMARNLYLPKNIHGLTNEQQNEIIQRFSKGYNKMKDEPELKQLVQAITSYRHMLKLFNVHDDQVHLFKITFLQQVLLMLISLIRLCLSLVFYLPGNIITFPLSTAIAYYTENERIKALKSSSVKIRANDVRASIKILAYMSTYPIYVILFTVLFNRLLRWYLQYSFVQAYSLTALFFVLYPIFSIISIRSHEGVQTHYKNFQGRMLSLFYPGQVQLLQSTRRVLKRKVREQVDKIGPKVFKNFDKMRLIMRDPQLGHKQRSQSYNDYGEHLQVDLDNQDLDLWLSERQNPQVDSRNASRGHSRNNSNLNNSQAGVSGGISAGVSAVSDYKLSYEEQLGINNAFNMISGTIMGFMGEAGGEQPAASTSQQEKKDN